MKQNLFTARDTILFSFLPRGQSRGKMSVRLSVRHTPVFCLNGYIHCPEKSEPPKDFAIP